MMPTEMGFLTNLCKFVAVGSIYSRAHSIRSLIIVFWYLHMQCTLRRCEQESGVHCRRSLADCPFWVSKMEISFYGALLLGVVVGLWMVTVLLFSVLAAFPLLTLVFPVQSPLWLWIRIWKERSQRH
jgi:hypothetical protein